MCRKVSDFLSRVMADPESASEDIRCSFCGSERHEVDHMIALSRLPDAALYICGPCVQVCVQIMYSNGSDSGLVTVTASEIATLRESDRELRALREQGRSLQRPLEEFLERMQRTLLYPHDRNG